MTDTTGTTTAGELIDGAPRIPQLDALPRKYAVMILEAAGREHVEALSDPIVSRWQVTNLRVARDDDDGWYGTMTAVVTYPDEPGRVIHAQVAKFSIEAFGLSLFWKMTDCLTLGAAEMDALGKSRRRR